MCMLASYTVSDTALTYIATVYIAVCDSAVLAAPPIASLDDRVLHLVTELCALQ